MATNLKHLVEHDKEGCEATITSSTPKLVSSTISCKDGTTGDITIKIKSPSLLEGIENYNSPKEGKKRLTFVSKFKRKDCGNLKPKKS
ncbi:MAG TPA: hypothetical protein VNJ08_07650 [Bacteriovoracaceae bacterium]|nr:hypothetical protein [Bacteriovoracaceae bacterium]